jgi:hypothetical protein
VCATLLTTLKELTTKITEYTKRVQLFLRGKIAQARPTLRQAQGLELAETAPHRSFERSNQHDAMCCGTQLRYLKIKITPHI